MIFQPTVTRAARWTDDVVERELRQRTRERVRWHARHPDAIDRRLAELDREWDIERKLQATGGSVILGGLALGAAVHRSFFWVSGLAAGFLLNHALTGWCPPLPLFRRQGARTAKEIAIERAALQALRGDFAGVRRARRSASEEDAAREADAAIEAAERAIRTGSTRRP